MSGTIPLIGRGTFNANQVDVGDLRDTRILFPLMDFKYIVLLDKNKGK